MYIKITKNQAGQAYYHLVESYRDGGKVRQRTLLSLGKVGEDRLDELIAAIARHRDVASWVEMAKRISVEDTTILGPLLAIRQMFARFGIDEVLSSLCRAHPKLEFDLARIVFTLVVIRFIRPGSKLKVFEYWQEKLCPLYLSGKDELHQLYRALDVLALHKEEIEQRLFQRGRDLLSSAVDVVLYDLTTLRFESTREDLGELRRFGYSKEMRSDCTQVVLGLLVDTAGIPLGFEVYPGNTVEGDTLRDIVERMREKFQVRRFIFVADRGLFSAANLETIRQECGAGKSSGTEGGEFIVGMKLGVFKQRHEEFYDRSRFTRLSDDLSVYETRHGEDRCLITWSAKRAERDRLARAEVLRKIEKKLATRATTKRFVTNSTYRQFLSGLESGQATLNVAAIEAAARKDGFFGIVTNVQTMTPPEIVTAYKNLWVVEDAFGEIKGNLRARPIFHWSDERIVGHLTLCFLAYFCEAQMTRLLRQKAVELDSLAIDQDIISPRPLTVVEAMRELAEVRAVPVRMKGQTVWLRTDIKGNAARLLKAIGAPIPPKILKHLNE